MADEEKSEYFYRLVCLVVDLGTEGLLKVFQKEIQGDTIQSFVSRNIGRLQNKKGKKKSILNDMQNRILIAGNESEFDISLLYVLLRNLTNLTAPLDGWDASYFRQSDKTPAANIARLKLVRNKAIAHKSKCSMKKSEFEQSWADTEVALLGLAKYYGEEDSMKNKIDETKKKELTEGVQCSLGELLRWTYEDVVTQLEQMKQKIARQDSVPEDIRTIKADIKSIKQQLNHLGMNDSVERPSGFEDRLVADGGPQTSELVALKERIEQMENKILCHLEEMFSAGRLCYIQQLDPQEPPIDNPNAFTDDEIKEYSKELGRDWEIFAVYLGYKQTQIDIMKQTYPRQIETLLKNMLKKWHDVVARCDENPKRLLAAAFTGIRDNRAAFRILGNRELVEEVRGLKPKPETEKKIQEIEFESSFTVNVLPSGSFSNSGISF